MSKHILSYLHVPAFIFLSALLSACGGGGSSDDPYSISAGSVSFEAIEGGTVPANKVVTVTVNSGTVFLDINSNSPYFSANFSITGATTGEVTIIPASPNLSPGQYSGTISVIGCNDVLCNSPVAGSPKTISVNYTINTFSVDSAFLNFSLSEGTGTQLRSVVFDYSGSTPDWTATVIPGSGTAGWWSLSATSGSSLPAQIDITANATGIPVGVHTATLSINIAGTARTVPMTLVVSAQGVNFVSPYVATTNVAGEVIIRGHGFMSLSNPIVTFGANAATAFSVVSDSEIRAAHSALAAGNYTVGVSDSVITLISSAALVVKNAPAFTYEAIPLTNSISGIIFDVEREAIYTLVPATDIVERYTYNGANWAVSGSWSPGAAGTVNCCSLAMSSDGGILYIVRNNLIYPLDLDTDVLGTPINVFPFSRSMGPLAAVNDGNLLIKSTFQNYLFRYDTLTGALIPISQSFRYANSHVIASADGSRILTPYFAFVTAPAEPLTYFDASSASLVSTALATNNLDPGSSIDRSGTRSILAHNGAIDEHRVYDGNFNLMGSLPPLDGLSSFNGIASVISHDGNRAYTYTNSNGMLRVLDLNTSDGSSGFLELGTGTLLADNAGGNVKMILSLDGGTLIIAGNSNILVVPIPILN